MFEKIKNFFSSSTFKSWFLGSSGYFMSGATCPYCGKPGCPAGIGIGVMVGGAFALLGRMIVKLKDYFKARDKFEVKNAGIEPEKLEIR